MARIQLIIDAETPDEYHAALLCLAGLSLASGTLAAGQRVGDEDQTTAVQETETPTGRRGRPPKAKTTTASEPEAEVEQIAASPKDAFADQLAEVQAMEAGEHTKDDVQAALHAYISKNSMPAAQALFIENFQTADGAPVKRLGDLQQKDYSAAYALLSA